MNRTDPAQVQAGRGITAWIISHQRLVAAFCVLLFTFAVVAVMDRLAEKHLEARLDTLRASGDLPTANDLNAANANIPDDQNMAVCLLEHIRPLASCELSKDERRNLPFVGRARIAPSGQVLSDMQLEASRKYLHRFDQEIEGIHHALELDRAHIPIQWTTPLFATPWPDLIPYTHVSRVLALEAIVAVHDGDLGKVTRNAWAMLRFDRVMEDYPCVLTALIRIRAHERVRLLIEMAVNHFELDGVLLRDLQTAVQRWEGVIDFKEALSAERACTLDVLEWRRARGRSRSGVAAAPPAPRGGRHWWWKYLPALPALDEGYALSALTAMVDAIEEPDIESIRRFRAASTLAIAAPWYGVMWKSKIPTFSASVSMWVGSVAQNRALQASLACERYRLVEDRWPENLQALVPDYLDFVPCDPFDGLPIRYARAEDGVRVWSIGGNLVDDGGRIARSNGWRPGLDSGCFLQDPGLRLREAAPETLAPRDNGDASQGTSAPQWKPTCKHATFERRMSPPSATPSALTSARRIRLRPYVSTPHEGTTASPMLILPSLPKLPFRPPKPRLERLEAGLALRSGDLEGAGRHPLIFFSEGPLRGAAGNDSYM